jgi:hypothetical protein
VLVSVVPWRGDSRRAPGPRSIVAHRVGGSEIGAGR